MRYIKVIWMVLLLLPCFMWGQAKVGTAEGQFLEIGVSARVTGMGEAFLGVANDASAVYYNPGGVGTLSRREVFISHNSYVAGISHEFLSVVYPVPSIAGVLAFSATALTTGDMIETTPSFPEGTGKTFNASCLAAGITYSAMLTDRFSAGVTWKFINEGYADITANSWAVDIGTFYRTEFHDIRLGMNMSNFGPDVKFINQSAALPMNFHFGVAGEVIDNGMHRLTVAVDGAHPNDNLEKFQIGGEYWYRNMIALRLGRKFNYDTETFSAGAGLKLPLGAYTAKLDYSVSDMGYLKLTQRFSLGVEF